VTCTTLFAELTDQGCNAQWLWPTFQGYVVAVIALTFVGCVVLIAIHVLLRRRDHKTDEQLRRGMRSAWRRGLLKDGDQ
jgi:hypothetical protein